VSESISLLTELVSRDSVTPEDKGCQALIAERLERHGFTIEWMNSGDVTNLWARRGTQEPLMVFAGHTDVVPTGDIDAWSSPPFSAQIIDGYLCGRGAADMKGGVAAMVTAIERFVSTTPEHEGSIALLLTSDEEGPAVDGTVKVVEQLQSREMVGEAHLGPPLPLTASKGMLLTRTLRITRYTKPCQHWQHLRLSYGMKATIFFRQPPCKSPTSMRAQAQAMLYPEH